MNSAIIILLCSAATASALKGECTKNDDCEIELSVCVNNTCVCPPDFIANNVYTKCLQVVHGIGSPCVDSLQCSASLKTGGSCTDGVCSCMEGYHYFKGRCWKSVGLKGACKRDENCWVSNDFESSFCGKNKKCSCASGYYQREYSSCRRISHKPGDPCGIKLDCQYPNATCPIDRKCGTQNKTASHADTEIKPIINKVKRNSVRFILESKIGGKCKLSTECPKNAFCSAGGVCLCEIGFFTTDQTSCYPELGSLCKEDSECLGKNTMCRDGQYCTCKQGYVSSQDGKYCDKLSRELFWSCLRDEECGLFGPRSICLDKKCNCRNDSYYVDKKMYCWTKLKVGEQCKDNLDCGTSNVTCSKSKCTCLPGMHPSSTRDICRSNSPHFGDNCVEALDCVYPNSDCNQTIGQCICKTGYITNGTTCKPGNGGQCKTDYDCSVTNSRCIKSVCTCDEDYVSDSTFGLCLPVTKSYSGHCQVNEQCYLLDADCQNNHCLCRDGMHYDQGWKCFTKSYIGGNCTHQSDCTYIKHANCTRHTCTCNPGYRRKSRTSCSLGCILTPELPAFFVSIWGLFLIAKALK